VESSKPTRPGSFLAEFRQAFRNLSSLETGGPLRRLGALAAQNEDLANKLQERDASIHKHQETLERYESKLQEAKTVLSDKEQLEEHAMKQLELINRQAEELAALKDTLAERDAALATSQSENAALILKASTTKQHCILFDEPWIIEITHHKLKGALPADREGQMLLALQGASASRSLQESLSCAIRMRQDVLS
jgi:DNA repair exonuclease SbcCD ATPase subunit